MGDKGRQEESVLNLSSAQSNMERDCWLKRAKYQIGRESHDGKHRRKKKMPLESLSKAKYIYVKEASSTFSYENMHISQCVAWT